MHLYPSLKWLPTTCKHTVRPCPVEVHSPSSSCLQVIVQNYNSVLTLSHLYGLSDAVLVHENDTVHRICAQLLNIKDISFWDVNRVIGHQLASVLQPALTTDSYGDYSRNPLGERCTRGVVT